MLALAILVPVTLYFFAIDTSKSYTASVEQLPLYQGDQQDGIFRCEINEMEFKIRLSGMQNTGDPVIFLHGFPQTSKIWQPVMTKASKLNYRLAAFDQRGYSPGARPKGVEHYKIDLLVDDVLSTADKLGFESFHLVGHDWGASVGWKTVMDHPERIRSWTALSIPHIGVFQEALQNHPEQQKRSSYITKLQTPILPEFLFAVSRNKMMDNVRGLWREEEISEVSELLSEHGALTGALNWYRAADMVHDSGQQFKKKIIRPTLYFWGNRDQVVAPDIIPSQKELMMASYKEIELDAGHALIQEKRDTIFQLMVQHWENAQ